MENDLELSRQQRAVTTDFRLIRWILVLASILFLIGIFTPMITLTKFFVVSHSLSVISAIWELLTSGKLILFVLISIFSIVFPVLKIAMLFKLISNKPQTTAREKRYLHLMHEYGRWAMLDVLVVAILIVTVKLGVIASIQVHFGLYIFSAAVLLIMYATHKVVELLTSPNP